MLCQGCRKRYAQFRLGDYCVCGLCAHALIELQYRGHDPAAILAEAIMRGAAAPLQKIQTAWCNWYIFALEYPTNDFWTPERRRILEQLEKEVNRA